jgi:hypothetical protein
MNPFRRPLLVLLNPRPRLWARAGVWFIAGFALIISSRLVDSRSPIAWFGDAMVIAGFALLLLACTASVVRRAQLDWYTKQLLKRGAVLCPTCGYNLKGLTDPRCPECGTDIDAAASEAARMVQPDK